MILLKFKTEIKGDVTQAGFEDQIMLQATSFTAARAVAVSTGSAGRETGTPDFQEISCIKDFDIASTELFMQSVSGASLEEATLTFTQTDSDGNPQVFLTITLGNPIITSYAHNGSPDQKPTESFTINYDKIVIAYTQCTGEAAVEASPKGWDLMANKAA